MAALRADLEAAGWTVDAVTDRLGPVAAAALARGEALPAERVTRALGRQPLAVLTRTFTLGRATTRADLDAALPRTGTDGAAALGLVAAAGAAHDDAVRPLVDVRPYAATDAAGEAAWWLVCDPGEPAVTGPLPTDHVPGVGGASTTLAQLTVRDPVRRALDVGTGCGVQALHAARHAAGVVATDVSRRALAFARLNTALAGVDVDLRRGSLLDPVAGERFDLVVANPPFVVTPRRADFPAWTYRDAGLPGDEAVRRLVTGVGDVLAPGGTAQLLGGWEHHAGEDWRDRVGGWCEAAGLDAWVVQRSVLDPAEHAETWLRDGGEPPGPRRDALLEAWLDDLAARGVEAVGAGSLVLRRPRRERAGDVRLEELPGPVHQPLGGHVARVLAARDLLAGLDDESLLARRWRVAPDVTEERHHRPGEADPAVVLLVANDGYRRRVRASTVVAAAVGACDGELTAGQVAGALAAILDVPLAEVRADLVPALRGLVGDGLLQPAG